MEFNFDPLISGLVLLFLLSSIATFIDFKRWKHFRSTTFKVAKISDNLGNSNFKIVGKDSEGEFQELIEFAIFKVSFSYSIPRHYGNSFLSREIAEKELNNFLIHIGQVKYKRDIEILDTH